MQNLLLEVALDFIDFLGKILAGVHFLGGIIETDVWAKHTCQAYIRVYSLGSEAY